MYCAKCGAEILEDSKFCGKCGAPAEKPQTPKKKSKAGIIVAVIMIVLVLAAVIAGVLLWNSPKFRHSLEIKKAESCMKKENYEEAIEAYENAMDWISDSKEAKNGYIEACLGLAEQYAEEKKYEEAIDTYKKVLRKDKDNKEAMAGQVECFVALGQQYLNRGNLDKADAYFESAIDADSKNVKAYKGLSDVLLQRDEIEEAIRVLQEGYLYTGKKSLQERADYILENTIIIAEDVSNQYNSFRYEYDEHGNITLSQYNGEMYTYEYTYDENGNMTYYAYYDNGELGCEEISQYDANGNMIENKCCSYHTNGVDITLNKFDENGNVTYSAYYRDENTLSYEEIIEYDEWNNMVSDKNIYYQNDGSVEVYTSTYVYKYDADGNILYQGYYDSTGILTGEDFMEYNSNGDMISLTTNWLDSTGAVETSNSRFEYEYDDRGNRTSYTESDAEGNLVYSDFDYYDYLGDLTYSLECYYSDYYYSCYTDEYNYEYDEDGKLVSDSHTYSSEYYDTYSFTTDYYTYTEKHIYDFMGNVTEEAFNRDGDKTVTYYTYTYRFIGE